MYAPTPKQHLERSLRRADAIHCTHQRDKADFTGCPRPPVHDTDERQLTVWRTLDWAGSPALQTALSLDNETILWAYRRIWGKTPMWVCRKTGDFHISRTQLRLIAFHACGYRRAGGGPPMKQVVMEVPDGPYF